MSPARKNAMIHRDHPDLSIIQQCRLVRLGRSAFYDTPVGIDAATLTLMKQIDRWSRSSRSSVVARLQLICVGTGSSLAAIACEG